MPHDTNRSGGRLGTLLHRWPTLIGLLAAALQILTGADRETVGIVVTVAATCYLAAAAFGVPWVAWAAIPGCTLLITGGQLLFGAGPLTTLAVTAAVLVVIGLLTRASRAALTAQTAAALVYGGLTVAAFAMAQPAGVAVVAITLMAHAGWDIVHLRRRIVVPGSMAEFCIALDLTLGLAVLIGLLTT